MTDKKITPVRINYDWWDDAGERQPAGQVVLMTVADAKAMIASGKGDRADPLPGET